MAHQPDTVSFDAEGLRLNTSEDAQFICKQLEGKNVSVLILQGNTFGIEAAETVGLELAKHSNLREAHFKDLFTSRGREEVPIAMKHLLQGISNSGAQLTLLDLSDNAIGPIGAPSVIEFLNSDACETVEKLYLNNCGLGPEGSTSIAASIPKLRKLREFICGRNRLENKGATNMSRALAELGNLEVLRLNQNGILVEGIKKLVDALEANIETIREFDISDNTIKSEGCEALARVVSRAHNLRVVRLDDALLENDGFKIICDALAISPSLHELDQATFEGNELCGQKIIDLIESTFVGCKTDFTLNLLENDFTPKELIRLDALKDRFEIQVDDPDSDSGEEDEDDSQDDENSDETEDGAVEDESGLSHGYVDVGDLESDFREIARDFVESVKTAPYDESLVNSFFTQLISMADRPGNSPARFQATQILSEELGLIKFEQTGKRNPIEREAIIYLGKRKDELPDTLRTFFEATVKTNDDLSCGKLLFAGFEKLEI